MVIGKIYQVIFLDHPLGKVSQFSNTFMALETLFFTAALLSFSKTLILPIISAFLSGLSRARIVRLEIDHALTKTLLSFKRIYKVDITSSVSSLVRFRFTNSMAKCHLTIGSLSLSDCFKSWGKSPSNKFRVGSGDLFQGVRSSSPNQII
jgi:hypothetical protein